MRVACPLLAMLSVQIAAPAAVSCQAPTDSRTSDQGSVNPGLVLDGVIVPEQMLKWSAALRDGELVQFRFLTVDDVEIEIRRPNGEPARLLGGWVDGLSRWALIRVDDLGIWSIRVHSRAQVPVSYEVEWTLRVPWPSGGNERELPRSFTEIANEYVAESDFARAEAYYSASLATSRHFFGAGPDREESERRNRERVRQATRDFYRRAFQGFPVERARQLWLRGDRDAATQELRNALTLHERWAEATLGDERVSATIWEEAAPLTVTMVEWQLAMGRSSEAFVFAERSRARAILEQLSDTSAFRAEAGLETSRDRSLSRRLSLLERRNALLSNPEAPDRRALALVTDSLVVLEMEFSAIYNRLRAPPITERRPRRPQPSLEQIQRLVPPSGVMLFYLVADRRSFLFVVPEREEVRAFLLRPFDVAAALQALQHPTRGPFDDTAEALHALWRNLVPPAAWAQIRDASEVVVIPDGPLYYLPFEALVTRPGAGPEDTGFWLDDGPPIRYASSASTIVALAERKGARPATVSTLLSVAAPDYRQEGPAPLERLPGAREEADAVRRAFSRRSGGGEVIALYDAEATEANVRTALPQADFAHFATHGLVAPPWDGLFASLALSFDSESDGAADPRNDGFLQLHEIYGLDLSRMELAVLSACETSVGDSWGASVFALSGGFLAAGASRVVSAQWAVDDQATALLISQLFEGYSRNFGAEGIALSEALREAKLVVRNSPGWAHPYFWAPFQALGLG